MRFNLKAACQLAGGLIFCLWLTGCASTPQADRLLETIPSDFYKPVTLHNVTFFPQQDYQCGPAALATVLNWQGIAVTPDELKEQVYLPERKGSLQVEMISATRRQGLLPYVLRPELEEMLSEIKQGRPVLVFQNLGISWYPQWHYAVVIGFDLQEQKLVLHTGTSKAYSMDLHTFERTWLRANRWAMIALQPGQLPSRPEQWRYVKASVGLERLHKPLVVRKAYTTGLALWPDSRELNMGMGNHFYTQKDLKLAENYYTKVIQTYPDFAPAHNNLALVLAKTGRFMLAKKHVKRAIELGGVHSREYRATLKEITAMQGKNQ